MATIKDLHNKIRDLNLHCDMNEDRTYHTVGQFILLHRMGGYQLGRVWDKLGRYDCVLSGGFVPRKQLWNCIDAYMEGLGLWK